MFLWSARQVRRPAEQQNTICKSEETRMNEIGTFDILGPNMIGPSSSHTAGALRIAFIAGKMVEKPAAVRFVLYGSFARTYHGHGTDRALVGGILGYHPDDERIRDSFEHNDFQDG